MRHIAGESRPSYDGVLPVLELLGWKLEGLGLPAAASLAVGLIGAARWVVRRSAAVRASHADASGRSFRTDLEYLWLCPVSEAISRSLVVLGVAACALLAGREVSPALFRGFGPVVEQPRWLVLVEMLVLGDFVYYWTHRMAHAVPGLWRFHAIHHSTRQLRWSSALRAHPMEAYAQVLHALPLFLLGFPLDALTALVPIVTAYALLIHSDINLSFRYVSYLVNSPAYHRRHHALDAEDGGANFAGLFPLFDVLFGTYRLSEPTRAVGIDDPDVPDGCLAQLVYPFRRRGVPTHDLTSSLPRVPAPACAPNVSGSRSPVLA